MDRGGKHAAAYFSRQEHRTSYYKKALVAVSYPVGGAIVALCIWPLSAGDILAKVNAPSFLTVTSYVFKSHPQRNSLTGLSFQERWSAVPTLTAEPADKQNRLEAPRAQGRLEKIPFSCELAFSRLVRKGNFSTRCIAGAQTSKTDA